jgi:nitrite reductase/ring-hydroxylating ferredoxin subunit
LTLAVESAIREAAPEVTGIEVEETPAHGASVIPVTALRSRLDGTGGGTAPPPAAGWTGVAGLADLVPGQAAGFSVEGTAVVGIRAGGELYAYRDGCPVCGTSLTEGVVGRRLGGAAGDAVLRCPGCSAHFDVRRAGRGLEDPGVHLDPLPLLVRDDVVALAVPRAVGA